MVDEKLSIHRNNIVLLSKSADELQSAVPEATSASVPNSSAVQKLRQLMEAVATLKAERDVIESELKSATFDMKEEFLNALAKDKAINEQAMSIEYLGQTYGALQRQVKESIEKQSSLIASIQVIINIIKVVFQV